jgi:hypothetical protein
MQQNDEVLARKAASAAETEQKWLADGLFI